MYLHHLEEALSTNDVARAQACKGAPTGTIIHTTRQLSGRGRLGRAWWSPPEGAVLMSIILRPRGPLDRVAAMSLVVGLAVAEVLAAHNINARIKWPNDILVDGLKVGGILSELIDDDAGHPAIIVGIGLNADFDASALPPELSAIATTLRTVTGRSFPPHELVSSIGASVIAHFDAFETNGLDIAALTARSDTVGARVRDEAGRVGTATGITATGALLVLWDGSPAPTAVLAGDIVRIRPVGSPGGC